MVCIWYTSLTGMNATSGASDATYHVLWVILFNAVDDFGIREVNELREAGSSPRQYPEYDQVETTKQKLLDEALRGALRISGLVRVSVLENRFKLIQLYLQAGVLASNGYLVRGIVCCVNSWSTDVTVCATATRYGGDACKLHPGGHASRAPRKTRGIELYCRTRAVQLCI
jgi:hypothetical protein